MFVSQAHSFAQQARLAVTLAWVAGYTNVVTILACGVVTSHASGTTSNLGLEMFEGSWGLAAFSFYLLASFFLGAAISGLSTELGRRRGWESIYVLPILIELALLLAFAETRAWYGLTTIESGAIRWFLTGAACCAMGLQNATITRISGGAVRTTHVTGVLTDFGLEAGLFFWGLLHREPAAVFDDAQAAKDRSPVARGPSPSRRRLILLASIIGTFALGAGLGALAYDRVPRWAMFAPVAFLAWIIYQDVKLPIAEIETLDVGAGVSDLQLPEALAVYHLGKDHNRVGKIHRMPNLSAWVDRLPTAARVVILDLGDAAPLNENAALELRAVLKRLAPQGRRLIVAGLGGELYRQLNQVDGEALLNLDDVCPDVELAIARGLTIVHDLQGQPS